MRGAAPISTMVPVEEPDAPQMPTSKEARIHAYKERYRSTLAEYAQQSNETSFQRAFSALVNTKVGEVFDALLKLGQLRSISLLGMGII